MEDKQFYLWRRVVGLEARYDSVLFGVHIRTYIYLTSRNSPVEKTFYTVAGKSEVAGDHWDIVWRVLSGEIGNLLHGSASMVKDA